MLCFVVCFVMFCPHKQGYFEPFMSLEKFKMTLLIRTKQNMPCFVFCCCLLFVSLCFVPINSVILNLSCVWFLSQRVWNYIHSAQRTAHSFALANAVDLFNRLFDLLQPTLRQPGSWKASPC